MLAVDTATEKVEWLEALRENIAVASGKPLRTTRWASPYSAASILRLLSATRNYGLVRCWC
eukprot:COSAG03_NODE_8939_length_758_cov_1.188164_1_plen_60_part_01